MELTLNLAWMALTALMCGLWVRYAPSKGADKRTQIVALILVVMILFPVISVTDDIVAVQNPAETDSLQRKGHAAEAANSTLHPVARIILPVVAEAAPEFTQFIQQGHLPALTAMDKAMGRIQNRPPPAA